MYEVEIEDGFSAIHYLKLYDGSWEPRHGHNWKVSVTVRSETLDSMGVVVDFGMLKSALKEVLSEFQYTSFNDHPVFKDGKQNPSTENIAKLIFEKLSKRVQPAAGKIVKVTVWETADASASYCA